MNYPQAFLVISQGYELPDISVLQGWAHVEEPIYVKDVSNIDEEIDVKIEEIKNLHKYLNKKDYERNRVIVLSGTAIGYFLIIALGNYLQKVYWIDNEDQAEKIGYINYAIESAHEFNESIMIARRAYANIENCVGELLHDTVLRDDSLERFFISRMWGDQSIAEHQLRRIAKNETRAGILNRVDLS